MRNVCFKKVLVVGIIVLFLLVGIYPSSAVDSVKESITSLNNGNTLYVGGSGPGNYTKIQDAIDNASDGDTVFVYNGTYYENIHVYKQLTLIGENKLGTIISSPYCDDSVKITSDKVTIMRFKIVEGACWDNYGIRSNADHTSIVENWIDGDRYSILLYKSSNNLISNNYCSKDVFNKGAKNSSIVNNTFGVIWNMENSENILVDNNEVTRYIQTSSRHITISNNLIINTF